MALGNGLTEQSCFNNRLQPVGIRLGSGATTNCGNVSDRLNLSYFYGTTNNNGNVQSQGIARPVGSWTDSYGYDGVNRLTSASESGTGSWSEGDGYDAFGNHWVTSSPGLPPLTNETPQGPGWYLTNNRISGWGYDGAGNITSIPSMSRTFGYDAESRMTSATVSGATTYTYDGDGRRVQKVTSSGTTTYVYDAAGQLAAEYSTAANPASGTEYLTADHLGSTRLVTDTGGNVTKCYDYLPFGAEIPSGYGGRSTCFAATIYPSSPDILSQKFTGKERDAETGLDFFGVRYFSSAQGRFTSSDTMMFPNEITNPQTWNKPGHARRRKSCRIQSATYSHRSS